MAAPATGGRRPSEPARFPLGEHDDASGPPARPAQPTIVLAGPDPARQGAAAPDICVTGRAPGRGTGTADRKRRPDQPRRAHLVTR